MDSIEFVEPDFPLMINQDQAEQGNHQKGEQAITPETVQAFEHAGSMICFWKEGKSKEAEKIIEKAGLEIDFQPPGLRFAKCGWKPPLKEETLKTLARSDALEYVEPDISLIKDNPTQGRIIQLAQGTVKTRRNARGFFEAYPDDPDIDKLFGMVSINAPRAWTRANTTNVIVAIIDSGIDYEHPDLKANVYTNTGEIPNNGIDDDGNEYVDDFMGVDYTVLSKGKPTGEVRDGDGHGSHVAGTIGAVGNNKVGVAGVNWRAQLMPLERFTHELRTSPRVGTSR